MFTSMCETIHQTDKTNDDMATSLHTKLDNQVDKEFRPPSSGQICVKWASLVCLTPRW